MKSSNFQCIRASWIVISIIIILFVSSCKQTQDQNRAYGWFDFVIPDSDTSRNVVDMSFLNEKIAGGSGFVSVKDGHFIDGKGTRIRFFGTNLTFSNNFPDKETAEKIAGRLQKLGMNVVRFHHMDNQATPGGIWDKTMKDLDPGQLGKLDYLIYQLKIHGIYSNINTHVSRNYPGCDYKGIESFNYGKGIDQFYRPYIEMQKDYAKKLLSHRNPYTGNIYAEEPAVAFVEVNNENSLISNWALYPKLNKTHSAFLISLSKTWLSSHPKYKSEGGTNTDIIGIIANYDKATRLQKEMLWSFLMDAEMDYAKEMVSYYKNDLKIRALICETQGYYSGVQGVYRETVNSDFMDMHAYWEHPDFPGKSWSSTDWLIRNSSMVSDKKAGTLYSFGMHRPVGMPLTISEYDHPSPSYYCAEMFPMLNSISAFQDFDGIYHFTFDAPYDKGRMDNFFSAPGHPLKQIFIPVGAVLFRMGAVQPGQHPVQLSISREIVLEEMVKYGDKIRLHVSNMKNVWEEAGANEALIALRPMNVNIKGNELKLSETVQVPAGPWQSETGEIIWDNQDSINSLFKINAPSARAAIGYAGGKSIDLGNVTIAMDTTPNNWATITLTSLDGIPVEKSKKILLVAAGRVENTDMHWNKDKTSVGREWGKSPTRAEGIPAKLILRNMDKFSVHTLDPAGNPGAEIAVKMNGKDQSFGIGAQYKTLWYILTRE
jgi:hypothetical protein